MNYVESFNLFGVEAKQIPCSKGSGAPTSTTEGAVGSLYMDVITGVIYKCVNDADGARTWYIAESGDAVRYTLQTLTDKQKEQARENISAADESLFEKIEPQGYYPNLLDMSTVEYGSCININNGSVSALTTYATTGYIPVSPGQTLTLQHGFSENANSRAMLDAINLVAAFDAAKNILASAGASYVSPYVVPEGVSYIRISATIFVNYKDGDVLFNLVDATDVVDYIPYGAPEQKATYRLRPEHHNDSHINALIDERTPSLANDVVRFTEQELTEEQKAQARANIGADNVCDSSAFFEKHETAPVNRLREDTVSLGYAVNGTNGLLYENTSFGTTDYISVTAGEYLTFQVGAVDVEKTQTIVDFAYICGYDSNKNFVTNSYKAWTKGYTVPDNVAFIRFSSAHFVTYPAGQAHRMVVLGDELQTFVPYSAGVRYILKPDSHNDAHIKEVSGFAVDAYLPKNIYCAVGRTIELYNEQVCLQANKFHMRWNCTVGKALKRKFSVTGTTGLIGNYTLTLEIYDDTKAVVWKGQTMLHIVSDSISSEHSVCPIGDSLTNIKYWLPEVVNLSGGKISFVGTYTCGLDDASGTRRNCGHEGRSGFSAKNYINGDPYTYSGAFESPHNKFWNGSRFSWAQYKTTSGLTPNAVQIFLGTNGIAEDNTENAGYIKQMVDYIRQDDASIPIFVVNTIYRGTQNGIGVQQSNDGYASQVGVWKYNEDKKVMDLMVKLDALLDGYTNVHMINLALTHDSEYNFGTVETAVNPRAVQTELMPVESVHPQLQGYFQMADVMFGVMCGVWAT